MKLDDIMDTYKAGFYSVLGAKQAASRMTEALPAELDFLCGWIIGTILSKGVSAHDLALCVHGHAAARAAADAETSDA